MIVKSRFKDYYDFVGLQFGGGDPRVRYTRERLSLDDSFDVQVDNFQSDIQMSTIPMATIATGRNSSRCTWLSPGEFIFCRDREQMKSARIISIRTA